MFGKGLFVVKASKAVSPYIFAMLMLRYIKYKTVKVSNESIILILVKQICTSCLFFSTSEKRVPSFSFVIEKRINIDMNLKSILVEMDVLRCNRVLKIG